MNDNELSKNISKYYLLISIIIVMFIFNYYQPYKLLSYKDIAIQFSIMTVVFIIFDILIFLIKKIGDKIGTIIKKYKSNNQNYKK